MVRSNSIDSQHSQARCIFVHVLLINDGPLLLLICKYIVVVSTMRTTMNTRPVGESKQEGTHDQAIGVTRVV